MPVVGWIVTAGSRFDIEVVWLTTALIDKETCKLEVTSLAGKAIKLDQRQLDLLVTAIAADLVRARAEPTVNVIHILGHYSEQIIFAGRLGMSDRRLNEMTRAIKLMPVTQVGPLLGRLATLEETVEVAVRTLSLGDARNDVVNARFERQIGLGGERIACGLDPFGEIRIPIHHRGRRTVVLVRERKRARWRGHVECLKHPDLCALIVEEGYRAFAQDPLPGRPKVVFDLDSSKRYRLLSSRASVHFHRLNCTCGHEARFPRVVNNVLCGSFVTSAPQELRTTSRQGSRTAPARASCPSIIARRRCPAWRPNS